LNRIPTLDGWRGIAILLVLLDHLHYALEGKILAVWPTYTGQHGVIIFFVLSGYLITSLLLRNPGDLRGFYVRRFFRLMPAAWTYLAAMVLWGWISGARVISGSAILACVFFYRDFAAIPDSVGFTTGHFWSLSLEEQYYLLWPPLLLVVGARRSRWIAPVLALVCIAVRADGLLIGCALALLVQDEKTGKAIRRLAPWCAVPALVTLVYCIVGLHYFLPVIEPISIALLIAASTSFPQSIWFRWLSLKPLAALGRVSYSVYVWQQFFVMSHGRFTPIFLFLLPCFVAGSYLLIERPCVRLGHRLTANRSAAQGTANRRDDGVSVTIDERCGQEAP
jgi:peptidoglycan/LPS O-acetylase OafA/YrhL